MYIISSAFIEALLRGEISRTSHTQQILSQIFPIGREQRTRIFIDSMARADNPMDDVQFPVKQDPFAPQP